MLVSGIKGMTLLLAGILSFFLLSSSDLAVAWKRFEPYDASFQTQKAKNAAEQRRVEREAAERNEKLNQGHVALDKGKYTEAIECYSQAIAIDPKYGPAYYYRGLANYVSGRIDFALLDYQRGCELGDGNACRSLKERLQEIRLAELNKGLTHYNKGHYALAIGCYSRAILIEPSDAATYQMRGAAYYKRGQYFIAASDFQKACELGREEGCQAMKLIPIRAIACIRRGNDHYDKGEYGQAIQEWDKAIAVDSSCVEAHIFRGLTYARVGQYDKAVETLTKAIALSPNLAEVYTSRGVCYLAIGQREQGISDLKRACEMGDGSGCTVLQRQTEARKKAEVKEKTVVFFKGKRYEIEEGKEIPADLAQDAEACQREMKQQERLERRKVEAESIEQEPSKREKERRKGAQAIGAINVTTGEFYPGVAGDVFNPRTGDFYPDVGGGYFNIRTGEFMPKLQ